MAFCGMASRLFNMRSAEDEALAAQLQAFDKLHPGVQVFAFRLDDLPQNEERARVLQNWVEADDLPAGRYFNVNHYTLLGQSADPMMLGDYHQATRIEQAIPYTTTDRPATCCIIALEPRSWSMADDLHLATGIDKAQFADGPPLMTPVFSLRHELGHVADFAAEARVQPHFFDELKAESFAVSSFAGGLPNGLNSYARDWRLLSNLTERLTPHKLGYAFTQAIARQVTLCDVDAATEMAVLGEVKYHAAPAHLRSEIDFKSDGPQAIYNALVRHPLHERVRQHYANTLPAKAAGVMKKRLSNLDEALQNGVMTAPAAELASATLRAARALLPKTCLP